MKQLYVCYVLFRCINSVCNSFIGFVKLKSLISKDMLQEFMETTAKSTGLSEGQLSQFLESELNIDNLNLVSQQFYGSLHFAPAMGIIFFNIENSCSYIARTS